MDSDKYIGRLLDNRYEIQEIIGVGGMAVVYKARCHRLNRLVAIKILKDEYSQDEEFRRRFHAESQAVAMLSHPNIVSVYDVSTSDEADYIVMELIDGISLKQYMEKKGVLNWKETLHFAIQIAKALEHAHSRGIVHRDIKPHNVMVLKNGSVKVADFGIARVMSKSNTLTKEALGSVHYISPEQAKGGRVDNRSDIYSLGVVMYEMMTGRPPYDGESPVAVAIQHINGGAAMPSTLNPNVPGGLEQIIMKAMAGDPDQRYPSATAMLYDMDEFRKDPTVLFDYNAPPLDDVTRIHRGTLVPEKPTTAQMVENAKSGTQKPARQPRQPERREKASRRQDPEERGGRTATIAVIACSVVAIIAIAIFLISFFQDGVTGPGEEYVYVPTYTGKPYDDVQPIDGIVLKLESWDYHPEYDRGLVTEQDPLPGERVPKGTKVRLWVSLGPKPEEKTMENLIGLEQARAEQFLRNQGYEPLIREENSEEHDEGIVTRTEPKEGDPLEEGQTVTIWVSKGPEVVKKPMPNVVGLNLSTALRALESNGFKNYDFEPVDSNEPKDAVVWQSEERNTLVDVTTVIVLKVSNGPTVPPTTEPTEPPTQPPAPPPTQPPAKTKKTVTWTLPTGTAKPYVLEIRNKTTGATVHTETVMAGKNSIQLELEGAGVQVFQLYVNGKLEQEETVDFSS